MRLFVAIPLDAPLRRVVADAQALYRAGGVRGSYTPAENLHLTVAFIGEYPDPDRVLDVLAEVSFSPFDLTLEGVGAFGDLWWLGIRPCPELNGYVRRVRHALAEAGIPFDRKRFSPHITLLRRAVAGSRGMPALTVPPATMRVTFASLMRSDRGRSGMIYTELGRVP